MIFCLKEAIMKKLEFVNPNNEGKRKVLDFSSRVEAEINCPINTGWYRTNLEFDSNHQSKIETLEEENRQIKKLLVAICSTLSESQQKQVSDLLNFEKYVDDSE